MEHILIVFIYLQVASHKQLLMQHAVGSLEYKQITDVLKAVERLRRITAQLPLEDTDGEIQKRQKILDNQAQAQLVPAIAMVSVLHPIRLSVGWVPLHPHMHLLR